MRGPRLYLLAPLVVALVMSTGCIDIFSARDAVAPEEDEELSFAKVTKVSVTHQFETTPAIRSTREDDRENVYIKEQTQWVQFEIDAQFEVVELLPELTELVEDRPRYLDVTIWNADARVIFTARYNKTVHNEVLVFNNPGAGLWQVEYDARGIGHEWLVLGGRSYYDTFSIRARALEPV